MPNLLAFDLVRESDQEFEVRTGWEYRAASPIWLPNPVIRVESYKPWAGFWLIRHQAKLFLINNTASYFQESTEKTVQFLKWYEQYFNLIFWYQVVCGCSIV